MRQWESQKMVERCLPIRTDTAKLMKIVADYKSWMKMHERSGGLEYFKTLEQRVPFFDEFSTAHIRAAITQRVNAEGNPADAQSDTSAQLLEAIVFLCIAQEFDRYQLEITKDLSVFDTRQQKMFETLKGESGGVESPKGAGHIVDTSLADDLGHYQTQSRMRSWVQLWLRDHTYDSFFITDSPAVMEYLLVSESNLQKAFSFQFPPVESSVSSKTAGCETLIKKIGPLMRTTWLASTQDAALDIKPNVKRATLTCYISPNETPDHFFMRFLPDQFIMPPKAVKTESAIKNTLIGLVEI